MDAGSAAVRPLLRIMDPRASASPKRGLATLTLGALGVVYGDIGTSPLYALRGVHGRALASLTRDNVYGVLSLIVWSLVVIVSIKYLLFVFCEPRSGARPRPGSRLAERTGGT